MIQRLENRIRLSVQLVRVSNGEPVWGDMFDSEFTDLFSLETAVSKKICDRLSRWLRNSQDDQRGQTSKQ
jgi:TolB-like protein